MTTTRYFFVVVSGWIQLALSLLLFGAVIWTFNSYKSSAGNLAHAISDSVLSASEVIENVAYNIQSRQQVVNDIKGTLDASRVALVTLRESAVTQQKVLPQYAENLRYASAVTSDLSSRIAQMGKALLFKVPTGIEMRGIKPILVLSTPLKAQAAAFAAHAKSIQLLSNSMAKISETIGKDAQKNMTALLDLCDQSIRLTDSTSATVSKLSMHDLPDAINKMKVASKHLKHASHQVGTFENIAYGFLLIGILFSVWAAVQSISQILMAKSLRRAS